MTAAFRALGRRGVLLAGGGAIAVSLAGCGDGLLGNVVGPPPDLYTLTPKNTFSADLPKAAFQLVVEEPLAAGGLNVARIALSDDPIRRDYFANARWTERAPSMVQTLLVESFENTGKIVSVGRQAIGLRSDYNLKSELREFQAEYRNPGQPPQVRIRLNAKLVKQPQRKIIASENFEAVINSESEKMTDIVRAFDTALGKVLRRTVEWTLTTAK